MITCAIRAAINRSMALFKSQRNSPELDQKTVAKGRKRAFVQNVLMGPR